MKKHIMNIIDILEGCYALCCCIGVFYFRMEPSSSLRILLLVISTIGILATGLARRKNVHRKRAGGNLECLFHNRVFLKRRIRLYIHWYYARILCS